MVGIIILNYIKFNETIECVESVKKSCQLKKHIFLIDNNSPNNSYQILSNLFEYDCDVTVILSNENGGYAKGNNIGIKSCIKKGIKYAIIANNDILFKENCIDSLFQYIKANNNCVIVAPKIYNKNEEETTRPYLKKQSLLQYLGIRSKKNIIFLDEKSKKNNKVSLVSGCCFLIDILKFKKMGAFDEGTFLYSEELILSKQATENNYEIIYFTPAEVIHNHERAGGTKSFFTDFEVLKSGMYYWKKYENASNLKLGVIFHLMTARIAIKIIFKKIEAKGFLKEYIDSFVYYKKLK